MGRFRGLWLALIALIPLAYAQTDMDRLERELATAGGERRFEILIALGELLMRTDAPRSLALGEEALELAEAFGDASSMARACNLLGRSSSSLSRFEEALRYYQQGIEMAEANRLTSELVSLLHRMGVVYAILGRADEGLALSLRGLTLAESIGDELGRSTALGETGVIQMMRHQYDSAHDLMLRALEAKRLVETPSEVAGALSNLGVISRNRGQYREALEYLEEALQIQTELGESVAIGSTLSRIARVHRDLGDSNRALEYHSRALALLEETDAPRAVVSTLRDIRDIHRTRGEFERALQFYDRYVEERDAVFDQESRERIEELQTRFEVQQRERENEFLRRTNRLQLYGFLAMLTLAAAVVLLFFLRHRQRAAAAALDLARQQLRGALLQMRSTEGWSQVLSTLRFGLSQIVPGVVGCRVFRSESREDGIVLHEVGPGGEERRMEELPDPVRAALESGRPVFLEKSLQPAELWHGKAAALIRSTAAIPLSGGLLLAAGKNKSTFRRHRRGALSDLAHIASAALRRLEDLRTLSVRETQLVQARRMEALGNLTAGIAHRFNNLMQAILGNIELAKHGGTEDAHPYLVEIDEAARRVSNIVRRLLLFSKRTPRLDQREVDLNQVVERAAAPTNGGAMIVRDIRFGARVRGDEKQLEEILRHLLANAVDAVSGRQHPEIRLILDRADSTRTGTSRSGGDFVRLEVSDNGRGIDPRIRDRVFDPFFTTQMAEREGLGLSMVLYLTERHGGWVEVDSTPDVGTTVKVFLPTVNA